MFQAYYLEDLLEYHHLFKQSYYDGLENLLSTALLNQQLENNTKSEVTTAQIDFNYVFPNIKARMEAGSKAIIRNEELNTYSETRDTLSGLFVEDTIANFDYVYDEAST